MHKASGVSIVIPGLSVLSMHMDHGVESDLGGLDITVGIWRGI